MSILYVDHNLERMLALKQKLEGCCDVEYAPNGWEGLGAAMMYKPELVVLNLMAEVMTGLEMLRLIRTEEALNTLPVIGFTDPENEEAHRLAKELGCTALLESAELDTLVGGVQQYLPTPASS